MNEARIAYWLDLTYNIESVCGADVWQIEVATLNYLAFQSIHLRGLILIVMGTAEYLVHMWLIGDQPWSLHNRTRRPT